MTIQIRNIGTAATLGLLILCSSFNAYAAPGMLPSIPLHNINSGVKPNVFITTDDSGSMAWEFIYEKTASNFDDNEGVPVIYGTKYKSMIPGWGESVVPARSSIPETWILYNSEVNKLYYNPFIDYDPWPGRDGENDLYDEADKKAVRWNPNNSWPTIDILNSVSGRYLPVYCNWDKDSDTKGTPGVLDIGDDHNCIEIRPSNTTIYESGRTGDDELQNFANWMQYHRTRKLSAKNALGVLVNATDNARMGVNFLNDDYIRLPLLPMDVEANKLALLRTIYNENSSGWTPLREALHRTGKMFLTNNPPAILSEAEGGECQQNFNILMTDGYWNRFAPSGIENEDGDNNTDFDGGPYADNYSATLADVAMFYYENDLRDDLEDKVPTSTGIDTNPKQHLVNYAVAYGLTGTLPATADPLTLTWPEAVGSTKTTLDDLWHAAFNSRGLYLRADSPQSLVESLMSSIMNITERSTIASAAAVTSAQLTTDSVIYLAEYNSANWTGNVLAKKVKTEKIDGVDVPVASGELEQKESWDAASLLDARTSADRTIVTYDSANKTGIPFQWDSDTPPITEDMKNDLRTTCATTITTTTTTIEAEGSCVNNLDKIYCPVSRNEYRRNCDDKYSITTREGRRSVTTYYCYDSSANNSTTTTSYNCSTDTDDVTAKKRLAFLRGDRSNEGSLFRERNTLLGDIVNSGPVYVGAPGLNYPDVSPFPTGTSAYSTFKDTHKNRKAVIYTGANDGMFHAFDAATVDSDGNAPDGTSPGKELLAYIPSYLFSTEDKKGLHYLTDTRYTHAFYNDLQATVADAYLGSWKTVLVSGARAGGRGYFALDITNPTFSEDNAASIPLWEFSSNDDSDLGFTYSRPQIGMLNDGTWVAIFGNGYNSNNDGKAKLFIVKLAGDTDEDGWTEGVDYIKISTNGTGSVTDPNGLSTPALADIDGNGTIDRAYAGDLNGNLWVFDLSGNFQAGTTGISGSGLALAYSNPLFTTQGNMPITTKPILALHPTQPQENNEPNLMVFIGSGQFLISEDVTDTTSVNYFYGVWDKGTASLSASNLVEQEWTHTAGISPTSYAVDYADIDSNGIFDYGWYIKLTEDGERSVTNPAVRGDAVIFNTTVPSSSPCSSDGQGWRYGVDLASGGEPKQPIFDLDNDGDVDEHDTVAESGNPPTPPIDQVPTDNTFTEEVGYTGDDPFKVNELDTPNLGRFSWQELLK